MHRALHRLPTNGASGNLTISIVIEILQSAFLDRRLLQKLLLHVFRMLAITKHNCAVRCIFW